MATYCETCKTCNGQKNWPKGSITNCPTCNGLGFIPISLPCPKCGVVHHHKNGTYNCDCSSKIYHSLNRWLKHVASLNARKIEPLSTTITEDDFWAHVSAKVRELRKSKSLSQAQLADDLGYTSRTSFVNFEAGRQRVPAYVLFHIAYLLDVKLEELLPSVE